MAALYRLCLDNALFLPSFPISDMSNLELEKAAMGPRRWIEFCDAFENQHHNDPGAILRARSTRVINDSLPTGVDYYATNTEFYIVPGGRYVVSYSFRHISRGPEATLCSRNTKDIFGMVLTILPINSV